MYSEFESILKRIKQGRLWRFPGGVHPDGRKTLSNQSSIDTLALPSRLYIPVKQHIGVEGHLLVSAGDKVCKGQKLTESMNPFAVPVHAPTSGTVINIGNHVSAHPSGIPELTVVIEPDKQDTWCELTPLDDYQQLPKFKLLEAICNAGISGMGGAGFPTHIKASPKKNAEFLIVNGVECEPYITADDRLMREHAQQIKEGIDVLVHLLHPKQVIIAIEDNKPDAIAAMRRACQGHDYLVSAIPTRYPAGGEKQLIQMLTNREVPKHGLPIDVGVIMQNTGTCFAISEAIFAGKPLIQRVVTVTGEALEKKGNVWALIGTPMDHLLSQCGYHSKAQQTPRVIMGGPMMGFTVKSTDVPVVKITNCVLVPTDKELPPPGQEQACIRCGACADVCPASLLPQQLYWHSKAKELDKAQHYNLFDCIECGACAYACPSEIPLVHYYRVAKAEIRTQEEEADKADKARERFEARKARLAREQKIREERHRKAAESRRQAMAQKDSSAKDKIAAALARAKAKQKATPDATKDDNQSVVASIPSAASDDKVAAAVARAKAKKAALQNEADQQKGTGAPADEQPQGNAKVAAAVARAKAKRAAKTVSGDNQTDTVSTSDSLPASEASATKPDKIAQAVARAKAKRAARDATSARSTDEPADPSGKEANENTVNQSVPETEANQLKKQRIAAAVAKAKAKKAAHSSDDKEK